VLVAADAQRLGAVDQLREYADLIGVPLAFARNAADLTAALRRHRDADCIFVDTAGQAPSDSGRLWETGRLLEGAPGPELLLVLSATTRRRDIAEAITRFRAVAPPQIVFTKLDETSAYGDLLSEAAASGCPVAWLSTGPTVPDDIEETTARGFAALVIRAAWNDTKEI